MIDDDFPARLQGFRESKRPLLSRKKTSHLMGLGDKTLGRYERGERDPGRKELCVIAKYYGVTLDELTGFRL